MIPCLFSPINLPKLPPPFIPHRSLILDRDSNLFPSSSMESFALPKLRQPPTAAFAAAESCLVSVVEEEEESFFELEFTLPDYVEHAKIGRIGDFISSEKPDPRTVRSNSKPQSTMSILRQSAPKLRVFMFGKPVKRSKPEKSSPPRKARVNFTVKLRIDGDDDAPSKKKFARSDSSKRSSDDGFSRKFSKDSVHKYLNLIKKPLYVKLSTTNSNSKQRESLDPVATAPRKSEERTTVKKLGKSRSAGALLVGASLPAATKDDSLAQQNDGIQGAILHCKQSFNSSTKERRVMSRCASDTSNEKSFQRTE